jgi:hypothetical protein
MAGMSHYVVAQYGDKRRYLIKALREIAHRVEGLVVALDERTLSARVDGDNAFDEEWCVKEIVGFLRDSEREDQRAIEDIIRVDGSVIGARRAQYGPHENDYRDARVDNLIWDFMTLREETVWTLRTAGGAWEHIGISPICGEVTLLQLVQEMNERDLDALWRIQRLADRFEPMRKRRLNG